MVFSLPAQLVKLPYSDEPTAATGMSLPTKLSFSQIFFRRDKALFFLFLFFFFLETFFSLYLLAVWELQLTQEHSLWYECDIKKTQGVSVLSSFKS